MDKAFLEPRIQAKQDVLSLLRSEPERREHTRGPVKSMLKLTKRFFFGTFFLKVLRSHLQSPCFDGRLAGGDYSTC
jgi:hypothetical protein